MVVEEGVAVTEFMGRDDGFAFGEDVLRLMVFVFALGEGVWFGVGDRRVGGGAPLWELDFLFEVGFGEDVELVVVALLFLFLDIKKAVNFR